MTHLLHSLTDPAEVSGPFLGGLFYVLLESQQQLAELGLDLLRVLFGLDSLEQLCPLMCAKSLLLPLSTA